MDLKTDINIGDIVIENGDLVLVDRADEVGQAIVHTLRLWKGEWRADERVGVDYRGRVLGKSSEVVRNAELRSQIFGVEGVEEILSYEPSFAPASRKLTISARVLTIYGDVVEVSSTPVSTSSGSTAEDEEAAITVFFGTGMI